MAHSAAWLGATQGALLINRAIVHDTGPRVQILIVAILHKRGTLIQNQIIITTNLKNITIIVK